MNAVTQERPVIAMDAVTSSQIAEIGHHAETNTLAIRFAAKTGPGSVYHYQNFTADAFAAFKGAESIGSYFGKNIKNNANHPYEKIEGIAAAPVVAAPAAAKLNDTGAATELPGGQRYSTTEFKENGDPVLLNADGTRSVFCDVDE